MSRLLITGGAGFIGANFVHYWLRKYPGDRVVVLDSLTYAGNRANLDSVHNRAEFRFVEGNICDTELVESLLRSESLDTIVHCAAESHVDRSIKGPDLFVETNVVGTHSLLKAARKVWLEEGTVSGCRFHLVSTDEVYGSLSTEDRAFTEQTRYAPNSPYSASKAAADHLVRAYHHTYGLPVSVSHCSNNYGPYQFPEKLIPLVIVNILQAKPLPVYGDGRHVRDWLHVIDHCDGIDRILRMAQHGAVYNLGGRCERENLIVVKTVCQIADEFFAAEPALCDRFPESPAARSASAELISFIDDRPGHDLRYAIDSTKSMRDLKFSPQVDLAAGLSGMFRWYIDHEAWWRNILLRRGNSNPPLAARQVGE